MTHRLAPTQRKQCGSDWGYRVHLKHNEYACLPCLDAHRDAWIGWKYSADRGRPPLKPCGTSAAYRRHLRHGEEPCWRCRLANRSYNRDGEEFTAA